MITQRMMSGNSNSNKLYIKFTASDSGNNINFFTSLYDGASNYSVFINDVLVDQPFYKLTFIKGDVITIVAKKGIRYYPKFSAGYHDIISSIDTPFPPMTSSSGEATDFSNCFYGCYSLSSIPSDLFRYNTKVTDFSYCFYGCSSLSSIPSDLFRYNTKVTDFSNCFYDCYSLSSISSDLFRYNTKVTDFSYCFYYCNNITSAVPELWKRDNVTTYARCFYRCYNALNYSSIPSGWK